MRDDVRGQETVRTQENPDATDTTPAEADGEQTAVEAERLEADRAAAARADAARVADEAPHVLDDFVEAEPVDDDAVDLAPQAVDGIPQQASNVDRDPQDVELRDAEARDVEPIDVEPIDVEAVEVAIAPVAMAESPPVMWDESSVNELRIRWDAIQMRFVDDPGTTAAAARALVGEAIEALKASLARYVQELAAGDPATEDTEELRQLVSRYRAIFESVVRP